MNEEDRFETFQQELEQAVGRILDNEGDRERITPVYHSENTFYLNLQRSIHTVEGNCRSPSRGNSEFEESLQSILENMREQLPPDEEIQRIERIYRLSSRYQQNLLDAVFSSAHFEFRQTEIPERARARNVRNAQQELRRIAGLAVTEDNLEELIGLVEMVNEEHLYRVERRYVSHGPHVSK